MDKNGSGDHPTNITFNDQSSQIQVSLCTIWLTPPYATKNLLCLYN